MGRFRKYAILGLGKLCVNFMTVVTDRIGVICGKGIRPPKLGSQTTDDVAVDNCMSGWLIVGFTSYWREHQLTVS